LKKVENFKDILKKNPQFFIQEIIISVMTKGVIYNYHDLKQKLLEEGIKISRDALLPRLREMEKDGYIQMWRVYNLNYKMRWNIRR